MGVGGGFGIYFFYSQAAMMNGLYLVALKKCDADVLICIGFSKWSCVMQGCHFSGSVVA